jgi:hypothetical protein
MVPARLLHISSVSEDPSFGLACLIYLQTRGLYRLMAMTLQRLDKGQLSALPTRFATACSVQYRLRRQETEHYHLVSSIGCKAIDDTTIE